LVVEYTPEPPLPDTDIYTIPPVARERGWYSKKVQPQKPKRDRSNKLEISKKENKDESSLAEGEEEGEDELADGVQGAGDSTFLTNVSQADESISNESTSSQQQFVVQNEKMAATMTNALFQFTYDNTKNYNILFDFGTSYDNIPVKKASTDSNSESQPTNFGFGAPKVKADRLKDWQLQIFQLQILAQKYKVPLETFVIRTYLQLGCCVIVPFNLPCQEIFLNKLHRIPHPFSARKLNLSQFRIYSMVIQADDIDIFREISYYNEMELNKNNTRTLIYSNVYPNTKELTIYENNHNPQLKS
jgi:hypothetical protein